MAVEGLLRRLVGAVGGLATGAAVLEDLPDAAFYRRRSNDLLQRVRCRGEWPAGWPRDGGPLWAALEAGRAQVLDGLAVLPLEGGVLVARASEWPSAEWVEIARVALQAALQVEDERRDARVLRALLPELPVGALHVTTDGEVVHYNRALQQLVGWDRGEVQDKGWTNLVYPDPAERGAAIAAIVDLTQGRPSPGTVRTLTRRDGTRVRAAVWSTWVEEVGGGPPGLIGVLQEVLDDRERRDRQVREEALDQLGRLVGGIAHDFNNLLGAVLGSAELLEIDVQRRGDAEDLLPRVQAIVRAAERGGRLARQLLTLGALPRVSPAPVEIVPLLRRAVRLLDPPLTAPAIEVEPDLPLANADPAQLRLVLQELLRNAAESGPGGPVSVEVGVRPAPPVATYRSLTCPPPGQPMLRLAIGDAGAGFSDLALQRGLEPFWSERGGHGVGLAAVRAILAASGGALILGNLPVSGGRVEVFWPIAAPRVEPPTLAGVVVWAVDDNVQLLEAIQVSLAAGGAQVCAFDTHRAALSALEEGPPPAVLVLDVYMPEGLGPTLRAALAARGVNAPVIYVSGHGPAQLPIEEGAHFLAKPFTGEDLRARVKACLARSSGAGPAAPSAPTRASDGPAGA